MIQQAELAVSNDAYHADRTAISSSGLELFRKDVMLFDLWYRGLWERKKTDAMNFGSACHVRILEPEKWSQEVETIPRFGKCTEITAKGKGNRCTRDAIGFNGKCKQHGGNEWKPSKPIVLEPDQANHIEAIANRVLSHDVAKLLIGSASHKEEPFLWEDPDTGILLKCKPDACHKVYVADLKTTSLDASTPHHFDRVFSRELHDRGYHRQAAFYHMVLRNLGVINKDAAFRWIVVTTNPPAHKVWVRRLSETALIQGEMEVRESLRELADRIERDNWEQPGFNIESEIDIPTYGYRE